MLRLGHRLLPLRGSIPTPGNDISGTPWQELMHPKEVALFCFDAKSGRPLKLNGEAPETPISEYCMAYRDRLYAKQVSRGAVSLHPQMVCAVYNSKGKCLETISRHGVRRRNEGLGLALLLLQLFLLAVLGLAGIVAGSELYAAAKHTHPPNWASLSPANWSSLAEMGMFLGACAWLLVRGFHLAAIYLHGRPARQAFSSAGREGFYRQLVREKGPNLLVPRDITFQRCVIDWQRPEKHREWAAELGQNAFQLYGQYLIPEVKVEVEFWINSAENITAEIINHPSKGMWFSAFTRYQDCSSITASARFPSELDPHPAKKIFYLGSLAAVTEILDRLRAERPSAGQLQPTEENTLPLYRKGWSDYMDWRRSRGTSLEEYKRIDARRQIRKRLASTGNLDPTV